MSIELKEVRSAADRKAFVELPFRVYEGNNYWVPPIKKDEVKSIDPEHNPAFDFCKAKFWLALENGKVVGRIGGIINETHNKKMNEKYARFTRLEFFDKAEIVDKLFETAEAWAKEQGMTGIQGPLGFTNFDHQAMLVEGFDHIPSVISEYHHPYYQTHMERLGYQKVMDWLEFRLYMGLDVNAKAKKLNEIIKKRYNLTVRTFTKKSELLPYAKQVFKLLNDTYGDLFSNIRLDDKMVDYYINRYFKILNPNLVKIVEREGEVIGYINALPSLSKAMQKAKGGLFPFGWYHLMQAMKKPKVADLMLAAVHPKHQTKGILAVLMTELQLAFLHYGINDVETTGMLETNQKAIAIWKEYEHIQHKRKRCFVKEF